VLLLFGSCSPAAKHPRGATAAASSAIEPGSGTSLGGASRSVVVMLKFDAVV